MEGQDQENLRTALKAVAVALKESGLPFALTGGYAVWALGGPEPDHDVDFIVAEQDAAEAVRVLADKDFDVVQPPEDWLFKVYLDGALVDVIFRAAGRSAVREDLERAVPLEVLSVQMPVLPATDLIVGKLSVLREQYCDFSRLLPVARALREQVDWEHVARETKDNDFAAALLFLLRRLDVVPGAAGPDQDL
ncbi:nucleotidyltransferase family protein [Pedococcus sp. 5OH_020]|uniref:nucleotidyltransferase family protein n=1 Tax=Pedococcus sp. 5OH_020 TaxID=2989814 RepID=UPI0022E9D316|nr:nucleotidyltransferase family protein [Pedococcus sp. 5OH_020]